MERKVLGVDIGGVIIDRVNDNTDTSFFGDNYLQTTAVSGAFEVLKQLVERLDGNVYLVSKCGSIIRAKTRNWLNHHNFWVATGLNPKNVHYCRERREKADICKGLSTTHFVDDRLEILSYLYPNVGNLFLFRGREN